MHNAFIHVNKTLSSRRWPQAVVSTKFEWRFASLSLLEMQQKPLRWTSKYLNSHHSLRQLGTYPVVHRVNPGGILVFIFIAWKLRVLSSNHEIFKLQALSMTA